MYRVLCTLFKIAFVLCLTCLGIHYWVSNKSFTFSAKRIEEITLRHKDVKPVKAAFDAIYADMLREYPGHVLPQEERQWVFMNAGGWMGGIQLLHASLTEYVLFFGSGINTSGNSGRYYANISDTILSGTFRQWKEGDITTNMFGPGDTVHHLWGEASACDWSNGTWMVEYARGFIPSTLSFALADTIFSTQDLLTLYYILRLYAKSMILEVNTLISDSLA